jgi:16S rRNA (adenine1518-N6/adenine1519-N6)-dimethyltransferase
MTLSQMKQILAERELRLTKSLGQNFLHDGNQPRRIVAAADLKASDQVLEIGPGLGPLTELLLARAGAVRAIEKDKRLVEFLGQHFAGADRLTLHHADALEFLRQEPRDWSDWKLVANLPYSVASPILVELARADGCPERLVVTLQREVAGRLVAKAGNKDYGLLTLLIQLRYEPQGSFRIPAGCFFPPPEVDSACVTLIRRRGPVLRREDGAAFEKIVRRAFSQRRKMVFKLLKHDWPEDRLAQAFSVLSLPPAVRAEKVSLEGFTRLTRLLTSDNDLT